MLGRDMTIDFRMSEVVTISSNVRIHVYNTHGSPA